MIYLDNAATTNYKPLCFKLALLKSYSKKYQANPNRSGHDISTNIGLKIYKTRQKITSFFGLKENSNVIFTSGCTESLNVAIFGLLKKGGHIITTIYEHNSVLRPLYELKSKGLIELSIIEPKINAPVTVTDISNNYKPNTYMVITNHISNVYGVECDIESIGKFCKDRNIIYLVDGAQSAGYKNLNKMLDNVDLFAVACHKGLYSSNGLGLLLINNHKIKIRPFKFGGTGTNSDSFYQPYELPEGLEAGTSSFSNIFALNSSIDWISKHQKQLINKNKLLSKYLIENLKKMHNIICYNSITNANGVVSFNVKGYHSSEVANILNDKKICVRSGMHCAPLVHKQLNTKDIGTIRVSFGYKNTYQDINKLLKVLKNL